LGLRPANLVEKPNDILISTEAITVCEEHENRRHTLLGLHDELVHEIKEPCIDGGVVVTADVVNAGSVDLG
jgi:hypothetical protein